MVELEHTHPNRSQSVLLDQDLDVGPGSGEARFQVSLHSLKVRQK